MDQVPDYLLRAYEILMQSVIRGTTSEVNEDSLVKTTQQIAGEFATWASDNDFWTTTHEQFGKSRLTYAQEGTVFDREVEILTKALKGDRQAAILVAIELGTKREDANPDVARTKVSDAAKEGRQTAQEPSGRSRAWHAAIFLKKALTIAAGGIGIAADLVSPDVTGITKVASIAGGLAAIVNV